MYMEYYEVRNKMITFAFVGEILEMEINQENIDRLLHAMFKLVSGLKQGMDDCCETMGDLSEKEYVIINHIGQNQNVKMRDLADNLGAPFSTITSVVDKLVDKKLLTRYHSNEDRRVVLVTLASKGKESYDAFTEKKRFIAVQVLSQLEDHEQPKFIEMLEKIKLTPPDDD